MCLGVLLACMSVPGALRVEKKFTMWVLETEPGSSGKAASALYHGAISPAPKQ